MAKDLLYRPDLSYDKSYYTEGDINNFNEEQNINSQDSTDNLYNKLDNINDLLQEIISKLPAIPNDLLDVFLPSFVIVNDVLKDFINDPEKIPTMPEKDNEPEVTPMPGITVVPSNPDSTEIPDDPFGIEEDIYIDIKVQDFSEEEAIEREYALDLIDILEDYIIKYNNVLDKYIVNVMTSLSLSDFSSLKVIATKNLNNNDLSHVTDYLTKSKIALKQKLKLYSKMFDMDETIFHIRSVKVVNEQRKRYRTNKKLEDKNALTKSANDLLRESILVAEKKYEENFYGLYKYLNSSVILFNECTNVVIKQKQALVLINNQEREK